ALLPPAPAQPVDPVAGVLEAKNRERVLLEDLLRAGEHLHLDQLEHGPETRREGEDREGLLFPRRPLDDHDRLLLQVLRAKLDAKRDALRLPVVEFLARP